MFRLLILYAIISLSLLSCTKESPTPGPPVPPALTLTYSASPIDLMGIDAKFSANISYNTHPRSKFDIFLPASSSPTALVIFVHGGGFVNGNKEDVYSSQADNIRDYLSNHIAFATVDYQFMTDDTTKGIYASLNDIRLCLQFIRYYATKGGKVIRPNN